MLRPFATGGLLVDTSLTLSDPCVLASTSSTTTQSFRVRRTPLRALLPEAAQPSDARLGERVRSQQWLFGCAPTTPDAPVEEQRPAAEAREERAPVLWTQHHMQSLLELYRVLCSKFTHRAGARALRTPHVCSETSECVFFSDVRRFGQLFLCIRSGNVHLCEREVCQHLRETPEALVCLLCDHMHPLDTVAELDDCPFDNLAAEDKTRLTMRVNSSVFFKYKRKSAWRIEAARPVKKGRGQSSKLADTEDPSVSALRRDCFRQTASTILSNTDFIPTEEQMADVVELVEQTWRVVVRCPTYAATTSSYTLQYHCLVVMYLARRGFHLTLVERGAPRDVCVVGHSLLLQEHMPRRDKCQPFASGLLTDAEKLFKLFVDTCPAELLLQLIAEAGEPAPAREAEFRVGEG